MTWVDYATLGVAALALFVSFLAFLRSGSANRLAAQANKIAGSQESGQKEKRDQLRDALDQFATHLSAQTSEMLPHQVDMAPASVAERIEAAGAGLPEVEPLLKLADSVRDQGIRSTSKEALRAAESWTVEIRRAWQYIERLSEWSVDTRDRNVEAMGHFFDARAGLRTRSQEHRELIDQAIAAIDAVERGEVQPAPPSRWMFWKWGLWKRIGSRLKRRKS